MPIATSVLRTAILRPRTGLAALTLTGGVQTDATRLTATQGDGLPIPSGDGVWPAATNLNDNGNATTNTTGVTDHSSTTTRVTSGVVKFGTTAFSVVSGNATANEGPSQAINGGLAATQYSISAWAWLVSGAATVRAALSDTVAGKQGGTAVVLTATPQKISVTATTGVLALSIASYIETTVQQAGTWRIGGWQSEVSILPTPYVQTDGGDATRTLGRATLPVSGLFTATQGGWVQRIKTPWTDTNHPGAFPRLLSWWDDTNNGLNVFYLPSGSGGPGVGQARVSASAGASKTQAWTITANVGSQIGGQWNATTVQAISNATLSATAANTSIPTLTATVMDVGSGGSVLTTDPQAASTMWVLTWKGAATQVDVTTLSSWGDSVPTINQIAMLSFGMMPTAIVTPTGNGYTVTLLPGYFA